MNYQPQVRSPRGVDPQVRYQSVMCDVCHKPRNKGQHDKCSKARQAAGFSYWNEPAPGTKLECTNCHRRFRIDGLMGNICRDCYARLYGDILATKPTQSECQP